MLYPQSNAMRQAITLDGFWEFRFDPDHVGDKQSWGEGFETGRPIAVPASWNDQFEDGRDYMDIAWYQTRFDLPWGWDERRVMLRFGSVNYLAQVWLNGQYLGEHEGGHLPFEFDVSSALRPEGNHLVVRVDGQLAIDRVPPGNLAPNPLDAFNNPSFPSGNFDFFPYCGIQRPVLLYAMPHGGITDIRVITDISGQDGLISVHVEAVDQAAQVQVSIDGFGNHDVAESDMSQNAQLKIANAALWNPEAPNLYDLKVELLRQGQPFDRYTLPVGIRTISVDGERLLLNGKPILLRGFGRHEDFPIAGRGYMPAVIVKDYALMRWLGANSFRTTHYPYSEQMMDLADRLGFLVIDETPAVGLFFSEDGLERRLQLCRQFTQELIERDKNHPSVIMWSLANEPHTWRPGTGGFFRNLYDLAKSLDQTRPVTLVSAVGAKEEAFEFCDVLCVNRYNGWYVNQGRIEEGVAQLSAELDALNTQHRKPLILTEFGADAAAGWHAQPPEMFSEEYQAEMIASYVEMLNTKPYVVGQHVWNLCDFKTGQAIHRMNSLNMKGIFTRERRPKLAAHRLRALWGSD